MKLPPSSEIVLAMLGAGKALTNKEIITETGLSPRTVRYALQKLKEARLITWEWNFEDARQVRYRRGDPAGEQMPMPGGRTTRRGSLQGT